MTKVPGERAPVCVCIRSRIPRSLPRPHPHPLSRPHPHLRPHPHPHLVALILLRLTPQSGSAPLPIAAGGNSPGEWGPFRDGLSGYAFRLLPDGFA